MDKYTNILYQNTNLCLIDEKSKCKNKNEDMQESQAMQVEIDIENPSGIIKPGMYAKVLMQIGHEQEVLSLPVSTQWIFQNEAFIMAVNDSIVERIPLRKGLANKDYMEILNNAIDENTKVIIQGKGQVQPSQKVIPILKKEN